MCYNTWRKRRGSMTEKRERFVRVAESRTNKIIEMIRLLGNCANKSNYEYDEKDVDRIYEAIKKELNDSQAKFHINCKKNNEFKL